MVCFGFGAKISPGVLFNLEVRTQRQWPVLTVNLVFAILLAAIWRYGM